MFVLSKDGLDEAMEKTKAKDFAVMQAEQLLPYAPNLIHINSWSKSRCCHFIVGLCAQSDLTPYCCKNNSIKKHWHPSLEFYFF